MSYSDELLKQLFFLSAAGLGALFAALYPLTTAVAAGTHDENEDSGYLMRIVVGLISGMILGQMIDVDSVGGLGGLSKPTLALLGGFSASLVFTVLTRLVQGVESVFTQGDEVVGPDAVAVVAANARVEARIIEERLAIVKRIGEMRVRDLPGVNAEDLEELANHVLRGDLTA